MVDIGKAGATKGMHGGDLQQYSVVRDEWSIEECALQTSSVFMLGGDNDGLGEGVQGSSGNSV